MEKPKFTQHRLDNVKVAYASVHTANPVSNKYELTITNLTDEQVKMFKNMGSMWNEVKPHNKHPEFGNVIKVKSKDPLEQIVDKFGNPLTDLIGNGSVCDIIFISYLSKSPVGPEKVQTKLKALKVNELVPYVASKPKPTYFGG